MRSDLTDDINSLSRAMNDSRMRAKSIISSEKFNSHKFNNLLKSDNFTVFSQNFKDNIKILEIRNEKEKSEEQETHQEEDLLDLLSLLDDFQKIVSSEIEVNYLFIQSLEYVQ